MKSFEEFSACLTDLKKISSDYQSLKINYMTWLSQRNDTFTAHKYTKEEFDKELHERLYGVSPENQEKKSSKKKKASIATKKV